MITPYTYDTLPLDAWSVKIYKYLDGTVHAYRQLYVGKSQGRLWHRNADDTFVYEGSAEDSGVPWRPRKFVDNYHRILPIESWDDVQKFVTDDLEGYLRYIGEPEAAANASRIKSEGQAASQRLDEIRISWNASPQEGKLRASQLLTELEKKRVG
jgi:hypothetical protein